MQKYKFNSEKFLEKSHFFKANSETPYHLPFCNIKESKLFSIPCRTNCNETFFCFVFFPFLYIWLIHKLIFIVWVFSWLKIPALNSPPQNKTVCFYYTPTLVSVCHSIRYILCVVYLNHVFDFLLFFGT